MRAFMAVAASVSMMLCTATSIAQQQSNYLRNAEIERDQGIVTVDANYPRPLQQVLEAVLEEYGWSVDYEDPPYQSALELIDATAPQWRAANPAARGVTSVRGGAFRTTFPESAATAASAKDQAIVIKKIVADYNASGNPGQFEVRERTDGRLEIVGTSVKDESGAQVRTTPILDTPITVRSGSMKASEALDAILTTLSAKTGTKVVGNGPTNLMLQTQVKLSGAEMSARDALHEMLSQARIKLHWLLLYDADSQTYYLNVALAKRAQYDALGKRHVDIVR
jgi:hypothetical protein